VIPTIGSRHPLWEGRFPASADDSKSYVEGGLVLDRGRETVGTTPLDAEPSIILKMPRDSFAPLILAVALTALFAGLGLHWWWLSAAGLLAAAADLFGWLWPERLLGETASAADV